MRRNTHIITLFLFVACAGTPSEPTKPMGMVERCAHAVERSESLEPDKRFDLLATECVAPILTEQSCRGAVLRSLGTDAETRINLVVPVCAVAYCPLLNEPRPVVCSKSQASLSPAEKLALAGELFSEIRLHELGPEEAARWNEAVGFPSVKPPPAELPPEEEGLRVKLSATAEAFEIAVGDQRWDLPAKPEARDFEAPATRVAQLFHEAEDPEEQIIIVVGKDIHYHHIVGLLNALGKRRLKNVIMSSAKE